MEEVGKVVVSVKELRVEVALGVVVELVGEFGRTG